MQLWVQQADYCILPCHLILLKDLLHFPEMVYYFLIFLSWILFGSEIQDEYCGVMSNFPTSWYLCLGLSFLYFLMLNPNKLNPSWMLVILVLSSDNVKPIFSSSISAISSLIRPASFSDLQVTTKSSAYLISGLLRFPYFSQKLSSVVKATFANIGDNGCHPVAFLSLQKATDAFGLRGLLASHLQLFSLLTFARPLSLCSLVFSTLVVFSGCVHVKCYRRYVTLYTASIFTALDL